MNARRLLEKRNNENASTLPVGTFAARPFLVFRLTEHVPATILIDTLFFHRERAPSGLRPGINEKYTESVFCARGGSIGDVEIKTIDYGHRFAIDDDRVSFSRDNCPSR